MIHVCGTRLRVQVIMSDSPGSAFYLGKSLDLSKPQFIHPQNGATNSSCSHSRSGTLLLFYHGNSHLVLHLHHLATSSSYSLIAQLLPIPSAAPSLSNSQSTTQMATQAPVTLPLPGSPFTLILSRVIFFWLNTSLEQSRESWLSLGQICPSLYILFSAGNCLFLDQAVDV